jgi:LacI family transcriptional regulator
VLKKPTIRDIGRLAGVSATTVSMALNRHPRISRATRERIIGIAEGLHYQPNFVARSLVSKRSHTLGLVITSILNPFYPELAKGIEDKAIERGYNIILCSTKYDKGLQLRFINLLRSKGVDGIIFSSVQIGDPDIASLLEDQYPFVLVNRTVGDLEIEKRIDYVVMDNYAGGYMAMKHLHGLGHRRFAIIAGYDSISTARERTRGARQALADCGVTIDPERIIDCEFSKEKAYAATGRLLALTFPPTAIFAENDFMALGVRDAVLDAGRSIPGDVALVGFDDIACSALRGIDLTTINHKKYDMGVLAVETLIRRIETGEAPVRQIILPPEIIIRKSCGYRH